MLYREIIAVCSEIHTKHINTLCGLNGGFLGLFANCRKRLLSLPCLSVRPLEGCSQNLHFSTICRENSGFIKVWQEQQRALCMKTEICTFVIISGSVLLRMRNVFDNNCTADHNIHFYTVTFFPKIVLFMGQCLTFWHPSFTFKF